MRPSRTAPLHQGKALDPSGQAASVRVRKAPEDVVCTESLGSQWKLVVLKLSHDRAVGTEDVGFPRSRDFCSSKTSN